MESKTQNEKEQKTTRIRKKVTMNLWADNIAEAHKMSAGLIYRSEYQIFIADVLDEALKNKMLVLKVLQKKEAQKNVV